MNVPENLAFDAVKAAMPFEQAEKLATQCARHAIQELEKYNLKYTTDNTWFDDDSYFKFIPMDNNEIEVAVARLSRFYLTLWHRRGLVGF